MSYTKKQINAAVNAVSNQYFAQNPKKAKHQLWFENLLKVYIRDEIKLYPDAVIISPKHMESFHQQIAKKGIELSEDFKIMLTKDGDCIDYSDAMTTKMLYSSKVNSNPSNQQILQLIQIFEESRLNSQLATTEFECESGGILDFYNQTKERGRQSYSGQRQFKDNVAVQKDRKRQYR